MSDAPNATQVSLCGHHALDRYRECTYVSDLQRRPLKIQTSPVRVVPDKSIVKDATLNKMDQEL